MLNPKKLNCWEFKGCVRDPGCGTCPAAEDTRLNGINCGTNGGRACWAIAGTLCGGVVQGALATKPGSCMRCEFYKKVIKEEGKDISSARVIQEHLKERTRT